MARPLQQKGGMPALIAAIVMIGGAILLAIRRKMRLGSERRRAAPMSDGADSGLMPYTVEFPPDDGGHSADLEHGAPLPRVGDIVEYIDERGTGRRYRVREVVHTLQSAADTRTTIERQPAAPHSFGRSESQPPEEPGDPGSVRAGLPKVFLEAISD